MWGKDQAMARSFLTGLEHAHRARHRKERRKRCHCTTAALLLTQRNEGKPATGRLFQLQSFFSFLLSFSFWLLPLASLAPTRQKPRVHDDLDDSDSDGDRLIATELIAASRSAHPAKSLPPSPAKTEEKKGHQRPTTRARLPPIQWSPFPRKSRGLVKPTITGDGMTWEGLSRLSSHRLLPATFSGEERGATFEIWGIGVQRFAGPGGPPPLLYVQVSRVVPGTRPFWWQQTMTSWHARW